MGKDFEYRNLEDIDFEGNELVDIKKIFERENFKSVYVELKPGKTIPMHTHEDNDQSALVLEGEGQYMAGDRKIKVSKGTGWFVRSGVEHSLINTGKSKLIYFEFLI